MIYFDNAATSWPKPPGVFIKMTEALRNSGNPGRGSHDAALWSAKNIFQTRQKLADLFNVSDPLNIAFTSNATESLNFAINLIKGGIVTTSMEHNSVLRPCYARGNTKIIWADNKGNIDCDKIFESTGSETEAIIMTHVSNVTGTVYDVARVGEYCRERNIIFIVDGAQSAGIVPVDVEKLNVDIYCFTGHKGLLGPQGTGGIYVSPRLQDILKPFKRGGTGSRSFEKEHPSNMPEVAEAGTLNTHGITALGAAVDYISETGVDRILNYEQCISETFACELENIDKIKVYGDYTKNHTGIIAMNIGNMDSSEVCGILNSKGIYVRCGSHCAPLAHETLGTSEQGLVRFSFSFNNTLNEIYQALDVIKTISNGS